MSRGGSPWRSRARGTTTGAPTQARADTVPLNPPPSTPPPKPPAPRTTIRTPPNRPSSRAEATGSFQTRPRVGRNEIPSPAWHYHHHSLTALCTLLLLLFLFLLLSSSLLSPFFTSCHCLSRLFPPTISVSTSVHLFHSLFFIPAPSYAHFCTQIIA